MLISSIGKKVNSLKKKEKKQVLKSYNMRAKYEFLEDKDIKAFKKSEITKLIQQRINNFLSVSCKKRRVTR
jgi:hypothetical protein